MTETTGRRMATLTLPSEDEILVTREFAAPPGLVFRAWTTPELVERWWPADRGEVTSIDIDLRVGGRWRYAMVANGGFEVAFHGEYREIVPGGRLVTTEIYEGAPDAEALTTATFEPSGDGTRLTLRIRHADRQARDMHIEAGMEDGLQDALDMVDQVAASLLP